MFKLIPDAARVFKISWSFWLSIFWMIFFIFTQWLYFANIVQISPAVLYFNVLAGFSSVAITRVLEQGAGMIKNWLIMVAIVICTFMACMLLGVVTAQAGETYRFDDGAKVKLQTPATIQAATIPIATPLVARWEGFRSCAYIPIKGDVPTIGFGSTRGVKMGECITRSEGEALLEREVEEYMMKFNRQMPQGAWDHMNEFRNAALTSLAFNIGWAGAAKSTAAKRLAAGNIEGARTALGWFNKSGGRMIIGLANRRSFEQLVFDGDLSGLA